MKKCSSKLNVIENKQTKEQTEEQTEEQAIEYNELSQNTAESSMLIQNNQKKSCDESSQNTAESSILIQAKGKQEKSSNEVKSKGKKGENEKFDSSTLSLSNNL